MNRPDESTPKNGQRPSAAVEPPPEFLPGSRPETRRALYQMRLETRRQVAEARRAVLESAQRRGLFGVSTST
jgi:hypothetical protein